jgi:acetyl esterase/lipase
MYDRSLMAPLAADLTRMGYAVWNIEYRRLGEPGGGWPGTFHDVASAVDALLAVPDGVVDLTRVVVIGHSAGGHLALWSAARATLPDDAPGSRPFVAPGAVVAQAPVTDLWAAARSSGVGKQATLELMGCLPEEDPDRYRLASPIERLPLGVPQVLVHGRADHFVPVDQSVRYAERARAAGDAVELLAMPRVGHFDLIKPGHRCWQAVIERLPALFGAHYPPDGSSRHRK